MPTTERERGDQPRAKPTIKPKAAAVRGPIKYDAPPLPGSQAPMTQAVAGDAQTQTPGEASLIRKIKTHARRKPGEKKEARQQEPNKNRRCHSKK